MAGRHGLLHHHIFGGFRFAQLGFEVGDDAVGQFARTGQIACALGLLQFGARMVERLLHLAGAGHFVPFGLPAGGQGGGFFLEVAKFLFKLRQPVLGGLIRLLFQRLGLDLPLQDIAVERVEFFRFAIHFHTQARRRLVHQVDGLVGQEAVRDVAAGQGSRRRQARCR